MTTGTRITSITAAAISIAVVKSVAPISSTSSGATTMPPKLAPLSASEIASPRRAVNHWLINVGMVTRPRPEPAERHQQIRRIDLPRLAREREQGDGEPERRDAEQHEAPRAEARERVVGEDHEHAVEQVCRGARARDQRSRPAVQALQFGEIDAVAVKPEAPAGERHQEARNDHAPAEIARGGFVRGHGTLEFRRERPGRIGERLQAQCRAARES